MNYIMIFQYKQIVPKNKKRRLRRCHIILRPHPKNRPRLSRDNKIDDISLNTHTNRFKFKPHISIMYIHVFGKNQCLSML